MVSIAKFTSKLVSWIPPEDSGLKPRIRIITGKRTIQKDLLAVYGNALWPNGLRMLRPDTQWMADLIDKGYTNEDVTFEVINASSGSKLICFNAYLERNWIPPLHIAITGMSERALLPFGLKLRQLKNGRPVKGEYQNYRLVFFYVVYEPLSLTPKPNPLIPPFCVYHTVMDPVLKLRLMQKQLMEKHREGRPLRPATIRATSYELDLIANGIGKEGGNGTTCLDLLDVKFVDPIESTSFIRDREVRETYIPQFQATKLGRDLQTRYDAQTQHKVQVDVGDPLLI